MSRAGWTQDQKTTEKVLQQVDASEPDVAWDAIKGKVHAELFADPAIIVPSLVDANMFNMFNVFLGKSSVIILQYHINLV